MFRGFGIFILLIPIIFIGVAVYFYSFAIRDVSPGKVFVDGKEFDVEIADTILTRQQGLSGREKLGENEGMLFVFSRAGVYGFWMKDMLIPIDIIWIAPTRDTSSSGGGETLRIVDLEQYIQPDTFPHVFYPKRNALYVLEVSAGFTEIHGIEVGDQVRL